MVGIGLVTRGPKQYSLRGTVPESYLRLYRYPKGLYIIIVCSSKYIAMADSKETFLKDNLFFLSGALSRKLAAKSDKTFASVGLSTSHALLLMLIQESPDAQPSQLAGKLHLKPSTITRLVQKLERRQLVERESEGRTTSIRCTKDGEKMSKQLRRDWKELLDQKRDELGERYVEVLSEMISNALDKMDASDQ